MKLYGPAKIIKKQSDYKKVKERVIVVAKNTGPDIVLIMDKVIAIVVETNNKLSHAAIVSREYGKPLVMGVKEATKRFKNGDMLEVDQRNKTVKKYVESD